MAKNEDGEFELILGNRQLLSVFFIVVVLLGVFFTMGYIVGRNSGPIGPTEVATTHKDTKPVVIDPPTVRETPKATQPTPPPTETAAQLPPREEPKAAETPKPEPPKPQHPPKPEPVKEKAIKAAPPKEPPPVKEVKQVAKQAPPTPAPSGGQPSSGQTYLQLVATAKAEADVMVDVLHKHGFGAIAVRHPDRPEIYRVLVGPIPDTAVNKTKSDLQGAGFPGDKAIRKTF
jgi:outer membrane biosynthesis protein TonB